MSWLRSFRELPKQALDLVVTALAVTWYLIETIVSLVLTVCELLLPPAIVIAVVLLILHSRGLVELRYW